MERVTIKEIAELAGVSKGAVSYALNGRPGVSDQTRDRILKVAHDLGWAPNRTARMLSSSRTDTFGLVLARPARLLGSEPFYMEFIAGLESELSTRSYALLLQVCADAEAEIDIYRRWQSERRVDAVAIVDLRVEDSRIAVLQEIGLPAVLVGNPEMSAGFMNVWTDDGQAMHQAVQHLVSLGHRRIARVAGMPGLSHVQIRDRAFAEAVDHHGVIGETVHSDFSAECGRATTAQLMARAERPTALLFDNDLMAVAGLSALNELGVSVPNDVSVIAWDDSPLCEITHPQLTAMSHDVIAFGAHVGRRLFSLLDGDPVASDLDSTHTLKVRESTAPPVP